MGINPPCHRLFRTLFSRIFTILLAFFLIVPPARAAGDNDDFLLAALGDSYNAQPGHSDPDRHLDTSHSNSPDQGHHLWVVRASRSETPGYEVLHTILNANPPSWRRLWVLPTRPARIAAWKNRLWMLYETTPRDIQSIDAFYNPAFGEFYASPGDHVRSLSSLTDWGYVNSFAGSPLGPLALLTRDPPGASLARAASSEHLPDVRLFRLVGSQWADIAIPQTIDTQNVTLISSGESDGTLLRLLARSADSTVMYTLRPDKVDLSEFAPQPSATQPKLTPEQANLLDQERKNAIRETWRSAWKSAGQEFFSVDHARIRSAVAVLGNPLIARAVDAQSVELAFLRAQILIPLCEVQFAGKSTQLLSTGDSLLLLDPTERNQLHLRTIDPITGTVSGPRAIAQQTTSYRRIWKLGLTISVLILGLLAIFLLKPAALAPLENVKLLGVIPRCACLLIDLAPSAILAVFVLSANPVDVLELPFLSEDVLHFSPYSLAALFTVGHSQISELIWGRSLGKAILGARIICVPRARPGALVFLKRNLVKMLVLAAPPLAIVMLMNHNLQGLHDMFARTIVVQDEEHSGK